LNSKQVAQKENLRFGTLVALQITVKLISKGGWARGSAIFILRHSVSTYPNTGVEFFTHSMSFPSPFSTIVEFNFPQLILCSL